VLVPFAFIAFVAGVQLRHYPYDYMAPLALITGLVIVALARQPWPRRALAVALAVPVAALAAITIATDASAGPGQTQRAARLVDAYSPPESAVVVDAGRSIFAAYLREPDRVTEATTRYPGAVVTDETLAAAARDPRLRGLHRHDVGTLQVWLRPLRLARPATAGTRVVPTDARRS